MNVLHLYSDWKWTGAAEPTLDLCLELRKKGCRTILACRQPPPDATSALATKAAAAGLEPVTAFRFNKRPNVIDNGADIVRLQNLIERESIDLLHVHTSHDHLLGGLASRWRKGRPPVIRTNHRGAAFPADPGSRLLLESMTDGYLSHSATALDADLAAFHLDRKKCLAVSPGMRLDRYLSFAPDSSARVQYAVGEERIVVGIVARVQRHRRFDVLLEGFARARKRDPRLLLVVVGRGTHREEVAVQPAQRMGIDGNVLFTGYVADRYEATVAMFDIMIFLVPGSDGTCRALREGMALGRPVIAARRGMIPEIVGVDGECGALIDDTPEKIAEAMLRIAADPVLRRTMGERARARAAARFSIEREADAVLALYRRVLGHD